jgi:transketolase
MVNKELVQKSADNMRILAMSMVEKAKSGHPGGAMGGIDFVNVLYSEFLNFDPSDMKWIGRDRFFLDPGHMSPMLYSVLHFAGHFSTEELMNFRQWGSPTAGHPEVCLDKGIENTSGPLGQGHTMAVGAAIAAKFLAARFGNWMDQKIYTFISDGGIQEEISQGAGRIAGHLGLGNLVMFYDSNEIQLSSSTDEVSSEDTAKKYEAWGWRTVTIDGNCQDQIRYALNLAAESSDKPLLIIGRTVMGKGLVDKDGMPFEGKCSTHGQPVSKAGASVDRTIKKLGGNPEVPFMDMPEVAAYWANILKAKKEKAAEKKAVQQAWAQKNPELAEKLEDFIAGKLPAIDYQAIAHAKNVSTRIASKNVLAVFAKTIENMVVSSADLSNSDQTDGFLNNTTVLARNNFSGAFLQAGVAELTMAAIMNGMLLHGGMQAGCGTFFVFSEYMKPAMRLSALMELPVKYIWSHDAFRVGEDGPTHQPIEQEAQVRLMEMLKNHSGRNSFLVLRPADSAETSVCWKLAMENNLTPTGLILSRQVIEDIPAKAGSTRFADAQAAAKGAYIVNDVQENPDIVLVANGSEVATLVKGAEILASEHGLKVQIVSAPSEGLFRNQPESYQASVIPLDKPVWGLTAGLPVTLRGLVGPKGKVWGLDHFGYSAPFEVLDEKFGFTAANVVCQVLQYLKEFK